MSTFTPTPIIKVAAVKFDYAELVASWSRAMSARDWGSVYLWLAVMDAQVRLEVESGEG